jgi:hypothetical protein
MPWWYKKKIEGKMVCDPNALSFEPLLEWVCGSMRVYPPSKAKKSESIPSRSLPPPKPRRTN